MAVETGNTKRLDQLLEKYEVKGDLLHKAFEEVAEEEATAVKDKAKTHIKRALELRRNMDSEWNRANQNQKKFDKELGKVLRRIENMQNHRPEDEGVEEKKGEEAEE